MAEKSKEDRTAEQQLNELERAGVSREVIKKINARALEKAKKARPKRPRETLQKWREDLAFFVEREKAPLLNRALEIAEERRVPRQRFDIPGDPLTFGESIAELPRATVGAARSFFGAPGQIQVSPEVEALRRQRQGPPVGEIVPPVTALPPGVPGQGGIPPVIGQPTGVPGEQVGIPPPPGGFQTPPGVPPPPVPIGQDPNLLGPQQDGPPLPTLGPQDLAPAPGTGAPTDPLTGLPPGLPPLPGLEAAPPGLPPGLPPLPLLPPVDSLEPIPVATPQSMALSQRMVPEATQQESQDIAEALDFISSGDPSFFDLDEGPIEKLEEAPGGFIG